MQNLANYKRILSRGTSKAPKKPKPKIPYKPNYLAPKASNFKTLGKDKNLDAKVLGFASKVLKTAKKPIKELNRKAKTSSLKAQRSTQTSDGKPYRPKVKGKLPKFKLLESETNPLKGPIPPSMSSYAKVPSYANDFMLGNKPKISAKTPMAPFRPSFNVGPKVKSKPKPKTRVSPSWQWNTFYRTLRNN